MPFKFNPFSGNFDQTGSGGGGSSYIDGEVATYNDLPLDGTAALNSAWLVRTASGVWPVSRKQAGIYIRTATAGSSRDADYTYAGTMPDVFSDAVFTLYDEASTTRTGQFNLGNITAGQNRVLTWPDGNATIAAAPVSRLQQFFSSQTYNVVEGLNVDIELQNSIPSCAIVVMLPRLTTDGARNGDEILLRPTSLGSGSSYTLQRYVWTGSSYTGSTETITTMEVGQTYRLRLVGGVWTLLVTPNLASPPAIGSTTSNSGAFTTLSASSTVSGTGFSNYLASPPAIGGTSAAAGSFTTLTASTSLTLGTSGILSGGTNTIEQRNTTSAQTFRIYNTVSGAADANFERGFMRWSSNVLQIGTEAGGTGSARNLELQRGGATRITLNATGTEVRGTSFPPLDCVRGDGTGNLNDVISSFAISASYSNYANGSGPAMAFRNGSTVLARLGPRQTAAGADFVIETGPGNTERLRIIDDRITFGGTTSSFPALKRSSTTLQVRLADDSAYSVLDAQLRAQGTAPATTGATGTAGDIRYDADYIYVCTAANTWKRAAIATW